jgi:hypothetical protein
MAGVRREVARHPAIMSPSGDARVAERRQPTTGDVVQRPCQLLDKC